MQKNKNNLKARIKDIEGKLTTQKKNSKLKKNKEKINNNLWKK